MVARRTYSPYLAFSFLRSHQEASTLIDYLSQFFTSLIALTSTKSSCLTQNHLLRLPLKASICM